jgi:hypothetical protein
VRSAEVLDVGDRRWCGQGGVTARRPTQSGELFEEDGRLRQLLTRLAVDANGEEQLSKVEFVGDRGRAVEKHPIGRGGLQAHDALEHADRVRQLHLAIAIHIGGISLVGGQRSAARVDIQTHNHFEDGNRVRQVHGLGCHGGSGGGCNR